MRVLTIIPARKGSKGVKNKNFLKLGKNTLLGIVAFLQKN